MKLPRFFLSGFVPVKFIETDDKGMDVLAYNSDTREFYRDMQYLDALWGDSDFEEVTEEEFNKYIESLKKT